MPILFMGLGALAIFVGMGVLFFTAMEVEQRKRAAANKPESEAPKAKAQGAGS
jgi:hypothetical protein